ncbi:MAG TPA: arylamine N-acetyltransferase [Thermoanaerobaculia bacterium]|nr:arylamine N-acetyltransferase [Thermoanaerobaculia bacterium]
MNLDAYLARLGIAQPLPPTAETLRRLHIAHLAAFPFHNLGIQRRHGIAVDLDSIERKFLGSTTDGGGYCFEQNTLFAAALRELGFTVTELLARVGTPAKRALNHMLLRVDLDGQPWLADVGFGAEGPLEPMLMQDGLRVTQDAIDYSLRRDGNRWIATMHYADVEQELYEFEETPYMDGDIEIANHYFSTHPASIFRHTLTIQRITADERVILRPKILTRYINGVRTDTNIEPSQLRHYARELFGIDLGDDRLLFEDD